MQLNEVLRILLVGICLFSIIFFFFGLAKIDFDTDVDKVLELYRKELKRTKDELSIGNKKINNIEKEILKCKKKLKITLLDKK